MRTVAHVRTMDGLITLKTPEPSSFIKRRRPLARSRSHLLLHSQTPKKNVAKKRSKKDSKEKNRRGRRKNKERRRGKSN